MGNGSDYMDLKLDPDPELELDNISRETNVLRHNEPMAKHCTWRTGGAADQFFEPTDLNALVEFVAGLPSAEPVLWLGLGSNLLVRDGGIRGTVISTGKALTGLTLVDETTMRIEAGVACGLIARRSVQHGCSGAEFLAGVPGTLGGALAMNAGAFGYETWDIVKSVEMLDRRGKRNLRGPEEFQVGYREVVAPGDEWFIAATLSLQREASGTAAENLKSLMAKRNASQPVGQASSGSVFRNPVGDFAARLIDSAGLKGLERGGARISNKHANFIINEGGASATDIEALISLVVTIVEEKHGITLIPEVRIVGAPA